MKSSGWKDMTQGPLAGQILFFSIPLILSNLLQVLFNMSDVIVVGRFAGAQALGSVGSTTTLVTLFTGLLIGIGSGVNVLTAHFIGAKNNKDVEETVHTGVLLCFLFGAVLLLLLLVFCGPLLRLLNTKDELIDGAELYLRIYALGMPGVGLYNFGNAVFSAVGDTKKPLAFLACAGVINVILNLFLVIVCGLGVAGVAIASVVSQYISAILVVVSLLSIREVYGLKLSRIRIVPAKAARILSIGLPAGFQNAIFSIANLFIQAGVNSFDAVVVEGNSAASNADSIVYNVMAAFYMACSSYMGQNFGAGKKERVMQSYRLCLAYSFGVGAALGLLLVFFGRQFLMLFTTETAVAEAGMTRLTVMGFSYAFSAFMDNAIAASRGLGKSVVPMIIVILGSCIFRIIWIYTIFAWFHTILSLYLLYIFSWAITAAAEILYFHRTYREQIALLDKYKTA